MKERLQKSRYLQIVSRIDGFALYHSLYGGLCIVDENIKDVLDIFHTPITKLEALNAAKVFKEHKINSFMQIFRSKGFLVKPESDEYGALKRKIMDIDKHLHLGCQVGVVQLVMTNLCNFRCKYCFVNDIYSSKERLRSQKSRNNKMMSTKNARNYLEKTIELVKKNGKKSLFIQFFGGEPLMNWNTIRFVLDHFAKGEEYGIDIGYSIVTNGSLLTENIAEYCKRYDVPVIVSFDSPKGNDRIFPNGRSSIDKVKKGLSLLKKYGNRVVFNSVLSEETFAYIDTDLIDFALEYNVFEIGVLLDLNPRFYEIRETEDIVEKLWDLYIYGKRNGVLVTGYWHMIFQQLASTNIFKTRGFKTCSGTGCQLSVEPSGDVFACKGSSAYFGNILKTEELLSSKNYRKYALRTFHNALECEGCEIENFCSGFCLGPLEKRYGDIYVVEKRTCDVYKKLTKNLIRDVEIDEVEAYNMPSDDI